MHSARGTSNRLRSPSPRGRRARRASALLRALLADDSAQGLAEYAVILGFIAVLCIGAVAYVAASTLARYDSINAAYP